MVGMAPFWLVAGLCSAQLAFNLTSFQCAHSAISQIDRLNCSIITRNASGAPTAGALATDLILVPPPELYDASAVTGGPIEWYVSFATCKAGKFNITLVHGDTNHTTAGEVNAGLIVDFTIDCASSQGGVVVAGAEVECAITTIDGCSNPSSSLSNSSSLLVMGTKALA